MTNDSSESFTKEEEQKIVKVFRELSLVIKANSSSMRDFMYCSVAVNLIKQGLEQSFEEAKKAMEGFQQANKNIKEREENESYTKL